MGRFCTLLTNDIINKLAFFIFYPRISKCKTIFSKDTKRLLKYKAVLEQFVAKKSEIQELRKALVLKPMKELMESHINFLLNRIETSRKESTKYIYNSLKCFFNGTVPTTYMINNAESNFIDFLTNFNLFKIELYEKRHSDVLSIGTKISKLNEKLKEILNRCSSNGPHYLDPPNEEIKKSNSKHSLTPQETIALLINFNKTEIQNI